MTRLNHAKLSAFQILDSDEARELTERWNATQAPIPAFAIDALVRAAAREAPDACAILDAARSMSYSELVCACDRLARRLDALGVRSGDRVAVAVEASCERLVSVLAVMRLGAAYVPLDMTHPLERLKFILQDCGARLVIGSDASGELLRALGSALPCVAVQAALSEADATAIAWDLREPAREDPADRAAYVIYTSGSTGRPKGVALGQRGLVNRIDWMRRALDVGAHDRILHKTAFGFDVSVWELFLPLISGATLVIAPDGLQRDPAQLADLIERQRVTIAHFVPSLLELFLESGRHCASLRAVVCSGETLSKALERRFFAAYSCGLYNFYGPTETTIDSTFWRCLPEHDAAHVPIGRPIANTRVYILDEQLSPVPIGTSGELCIGGAGVALGYLNRPDLNGSQFIVDPFADTPGARMYRTGDLARFDADGVVEFLGRRDDQIKLRGFRIELGEIEAALSSHPTVRQCAVRLWEHDGVKALVGYVKWRSEPEQADAILREHLARQLPEYMLPAEFVSVERFELGPSGKVDRKALPRPRRRRDTPERPHTPVEALLARIFCDVLKLESVSVEDNFFRLGGDSISSVRVAARAWQQGVQVTVQQLFREPNLAALARVATPAEPPAEERSSWRRPLLDYSARQLRELTGHDQVEDAYPLAPMQTGMLFRGLYWPGSDAYFNQNVLELTGPLDTARLRTAWSHVMRLYSILRTGFVWEGLEEPFQYVVPELPVPWEEHDWSELPAQQHEAQLALLLESDRRRGLSFGTLPLFRLQLVRIGAQSFYLLWSHHHVLLDGWCLALIWGNVFRAYEQLSAGQAVQLAPVRPYSDYIRWLRERAVGAEAERFWREYLQGFDRPTRFSSRPDGHEGAFSTYELRLSPADTRALSVFAQARGLTVNTLVQTAWALLLRAQAGADDVVFGVSISGRPPELRGVEEMVGLFINTVPLRVRIEPGATLEALLAHVQSSMLAVVEQGHVPLAKIKALSALARLDGKQLFDSLIAFENYPEENLPRGRVAGVEVRDLEAMEKTEYPLGLIALPGEELTLHVNYDTGHFSQRWVVRFAERLRHVLGQFAAEPRRTVGDLQLCASSELDELLSISAGPDQAPCAMGLSALLDDSLRRHADRVAICAGDRTYTYGELDRAVESLVARMQAANVKPSCIIAVFLPRSFELLVALLATWRLRAIYLPLDPSLPELMARAMLASARANLILTRAADAASSARLSVPTLLLDAPGDDGGAASASAPRVDHPDAGYLLFTSGSSGRRKGVLGSLRGLTNRLRASAREWREPEPPVLLHNAQSGFDISLWELLFPLLLGGRVVMPAADTQPDMDAVVAAMEREQVNVVHWIPSLFSLFIEHPRVAALTHLRLIVCGGEALSPRQCRAYLASGLRARLEHAYGPTEASISVTTWELDPTRPVDNVPLGRPIPGTHIYVVDDRGRLAPFGVRGELWIGGLAPAVGYLEPQAGDAARFGWFEHAGRRERVYRSGDLARWNDVGQLEYVGRADTQVKVQGHRIELEEVDAVLAAHPDVQSALTAAVGGAEELRLHAFCVPAAGITGCAARAAEVQRWLRPRLPAAVIPRVHWVESLPRSHNGKIDRRALPAPPSAPIESEAGRPRTSLEARVARIWADVLGVPQLGIHDNFFELGGHSLLMLRMAARLRRDLSPELSVDVTQVFKAPTVAEYCELLSRQRQRRLDPLQKLGPDVAGHPIVLVHPGEGLSVSYRSLIGRLSLPLYVIDNPRFGDARSPFESLTCMARAYVELIERSLGGEACVLGGWSFGGLVALEMARLCQERGLPVAHVLLLDTLPPGARGSDEPDRGAVEDDLERRGIDPRSPDGKALAFEIFHNGSLASRHVTEPYLGSVTLIRAGGEPHPARCGWPAATLPRLQVRDTPGRHRQLFDAEHAPTTARAIAAACVEGLS